MTFWHDTLTKAEYSIEKNTQQELAIAGEVLRRHLEEDLMISKEISELAKEVEGYQTTVQELTTIIHSCRQQGRGLEPSEVILFRQRIAGLKIRANTVMREVKQLANLASDLT